VLQRFEPQAEALRACLHSDLRTLISKAWPHSCPRWPARLATS